MIIEWRTSTYAGVNSGDRDERAGVAAAAVLNVKLSATNVELSTAIAGGNVESNLIYCVRASTSECHSLTHLLNASEVLAAGQTLGEGEGERLLGFTGV